MLSRAIWISRGSLMQRGVKISLLVAGCSQLFAAVRIHRVEMWEHMRRLPSKAYDISPSSRLLITSFFVPKRDSNSRPFV